MTNTEAPKATDITDDQTYLNLVAAELNNQPREHPQKSSPTCSPAQLLPPADTAGPWRAAGDDYQIAGNDWRRGGATLDSEIENDPVRTDGNNNDG